MLDAVSPLQTHSQMRLSTTTQEARLHRPQANLPGTQRTPRAQQGTGHPHSRRGAPTSPQTARRTTKRHTVPCAQRATVSQLLSHKPSTDAQSAKVIHAHRPGMGKIQACARAHQNPRCAQRGAEKCFKDSAGRTPHSSTVRKNVRWAHKTANHGAHPQRPRCGPGMAESPGRARLK